MFFRCENETKFDTEDLHWAYSFCPTPYFWAALLGLILYLIFFAPGEWTLWLLLHSIDPSKKRQATILHSTGDFY